MKAKNRGGEGETLCDDGFLSRKPVKGKNLPRVKPESKNDEENKLKKIDRFKRQVERTKYSMKGKPWDKTKQQKQRRNNNKRQNNYPANNKKTKTKTRLNLGHGRQEHHHRGREEETGKNPEAVYVKK